jgi:signal transduction histidine kinase
MNHFIKIFLSFLLVNYIFFYTYDNYYLVGLEDSYIVESRNELRQFALNLRSEISNTLESKSNIINQWAEKKNIPTQIISMEDVKDNAEIFSQLINFDYAIDIYSDYGPVVIVKIDKAQSVVVGPLDPLSMESTTLQPLFMSLHVLVNGLTCFFIFLLFRKKTKRVENAIDNIIDRKSISHKSLGEQHILRGICNRVLKLDNYINEIEEQNFQATTDQRDLMHAVAHELRSPIARFSFALELIEDSIKTDEESKMITEMHDSIDELESLIKEILSYSRLSYGSTKLGLESVDTVELIEACASRLKILYPQKEIQLTTQDNPIILQADRRFLERALINLLRNAARFATKQVKVSLKLTQSELQINIDDDGIGVPPGKRDRVFEAFTRLDPSRSRDSGGVGLGLAIVKKIAEKHQGSVCVMDSPLGGARFCLKLSTKPGLEQTAISGH